MNNSKLYAFKIFVYRKIADMLPDGVRRFVLYDLAYRADPRSSGEFWNISFVRMYDTLKD